MSDYIEVGQSLQFTDPNTPTRVGEIVENVSDIYNIPSPRLGMQVFVKSEKKSFVITSLKSKVIGGMDVPEAAVEAFEPVGAKSITWNNDTNPSDMDDFVVAGVYDIKGEHTREDDNLPIINTGGGHSFNARLTVLDSSIPGSGEDDDKCITQVLSFSNRLGQGEIYIRTGKGASLDNLTWEKWSTLQRNVNVGEVGSLDDLKENGIYSGVWKQGRINPNYLAFVCIVINDYFISTAPRRISQFVYGLSKLNGSVVYQSRVWDDSKGMWGDWEILNHKEIASMISAEIKKVTDGIDPNKIDSLKDIITWIEEHGDVANILAAIQGLSDELAREADTRMFADNTTRSMGVLFGGFSNRQTTAAEVVIGYKSIDQEHEGTFSIPAATTTSAGVMSAADKEKLDNLSEGGGDITAVPTDVVIEEIEPNLVSTAIRKTPQVLTEGEKEIARGNIGAADAEKTSIAITTNETNINNEAIRAKQAEADAIEKGRQLALRSLFVAAGAEYNDTDQVIQKTAPWGTEETWVKNVDGTYTYSEVPAIIDHLPKHYYLNGLGDITEEQMMTIYNAPRNGLYACAYYSAIPRVVMCSGAPSYAGLPTTLTSIFAESNLEILGFNKPLSALNTKTDRAFNACKKLSHIVGSYMTLDATDTYLFHQCYQLKSLLLRVRKSIQFASSSYIYKRSVLYLIQNAKPTSAITITLHADAYARIANQPDIIEALGAQPLITLVSA